MTLHISIDGVKAEATAALLYEHYKSKNYRVKLINRCGVNELNSIMKDYKLLNHETALVNALNESITYNHGNYADYDIVFWNESILKDYTELKDVTGYWLKQINNKTPKKDLYCYIKPDENNNRNKTLNYINNTLILNDTGNLTTNYKQLINKINECVPHCHWCNRIYKKTRNEKYCSETCRKLSREKQNRDNLNRFHKKHGRQASASDYNTNLGSNALLKSKPNKNFKKEELIIKKEKRRLGV